MQRQPAGLRSEHFDDGNFPGRLRRLTRLVEHLDGETERAVETERHQSGGDVVLDRAGDAHGVESFAMELVENGQPLATDDGNQGINFFRLQFGQQLIGLVHFLHHLVGIELADMERIHAARLAQHIAGGRIEIFNQLGREGHQSAFGIAVRVQQAFKPVPDADDLPAQLACGQGRSLDHGVHAGDEARAHIDRDAFLICVHNSVIR